MSFVQTKDFRLLIARCIKAMEPSDIALTIVKEKGVCALNTKELMQQLKLWKEMGVEVRKSNVRQVEIGNRTVFLFVIQPKDNDLLDQIGICPFSASLGLLVSGFGYICTSRDTLDVIVRYIGVEGAKPNPLFSKA